METRAAGHAPPSPSTRERKRQRDVDAPSPPEPDAAALRAQVSALSAEVQRLHHQIRRYAAACMLHALHGPRLQRCMPCRQGLRFRVAQYNILAGYLGSNTMPWFLYGAAVHVYAHVYAHVLIAHALPRLTRTHAGVDMSPKRRDAIMAKVMHACSAIRLRSAQHCIAPRRATPGQGALPAAPRRRHATHGNCRTVASPSRRTCRCTCRHT